MVKVAGVMVGLMKYVFMIKNSVTLSRAAFNPPWHLTKAIALRGAIRASRGPGC
jgi:hypothetical protein